MANPILVTGAAGRVGAVGRTVTELLLKQGKAVRAMVRNEDERGQALRGMGAEVVVGDLLDLDSIHRAIAGCETMSQTASDPGARVRVFAMSIRLVKPDTASSISDCCWITGKYGSNSGSLGQPEERAGG
jgi:uncharacterized protein YbjT (DUF2867 family)